MSDPMPSVNQRVSTGWGRVYVNIAMDKGAPAEVFVTTGQSGDLYNSQAEALGKLVSTGLKQADDRAEAAEAFADALIGIRTDRVMEDNGDDVYSIPDAVGVALRRATTDSYAASVKEQSTGGVPEDLP